MTTGMFAEKLKRLRESAGLSQQQLADRAGMNRFGVAKLEQGVREPSWATVQVLAKALGVDCLAFADAPGESVVAVPEPKRGRPRKDQSPAKAPAAKKPRSRGKAK